jgi:Flp pilus assembly protein TadB
MNDEQKPDRDADSWKKEWDPVKWVGGVRPDAAEFSALSQGDARGRISMRKPLLGLAAGASLIAVFALRISIAHVLLALLGLGICLVVLRWLVRKIRARRCERCSNQFLALDEDVWRRLLLAWSEVVTG